MDEELTDPVIWERDPYLDGGLGEYQWLPHSEIDPSWKGGTHFILIKPHASTSTKLHELGHAVLGHKEQFVGPVEDLEREIDVTVWSNERMGRKFTLGNVRLLAESLVYSSGLKPTKAYSILLRKLESRDIILSEEDKVWVRNLIKDTYKRKLQRGR